MGRDYSSSMIPNLLKQSNRVVFGMEHKKKILDKGFVNASAIFLPLSYSGCILALIFVHTDRIFFLSKVACRA